jgi:hypothetical protein
LKEAWSGNILFEGAELLSAHAWDIEKDLWHVNMPNVRIAAANFAIVM